MRPAAEGESEPDDHQNGSTRGPTTGSDGEDELALEVTAVEQRVRLGDPLERERLLHVDPEPALVDEFDETSPDSGTRAGRDSCRLLGFLVAPQRHPQRGR